MYGIALIRRCAGQLNVFRVRAVEFELEVGIGNGFRGCDGVLAAGRSLLPLFAEKQRRAGAPLLTLGALGFPAARTLSGLLGESEKRQCGDPQRNKPN